MSKQQGFTITELLLAVAVASIASVLMVTAFVYTYGSVVVEQTRTRMISQSQLFLRRMVEDIRVGDSIVTTNVIDDPSVTGSGGEWVTSDPANILIVTLPATDSDDDFIYDPISGYPYYHEIVYFGDNNDDVMYRRLLANPSATGTAQLTTCPVDTAGCPSDAELVGDLENMVFEFYDINDAVTSDPALAKSIEITINLRKEVYGQTIRTTNKTRVTLRNG